MPRNSLSLPILISGQEQLRAGLRFLLQPGNDGLTPGQDDPDGLVALVDLDAQHLEEGGREGGRQGVVREAIEVADGG